MSIELKDPVGLNSVQEIADSNESKENTLKSDRRNNFIKVLILNVLILIFFVFATINYVQTHKFCISDCGIKFCSPYILFVTISIAVYLGIFYSQVIKKWLAQNGFTKPVTSAMKKITKTRLSRIILSMVVVALLMMLIVFETFDDLRRLRSVIGVLLFLIFGYVFSYDKFKIKWRPVLCGFTFQFLLGILCIRWQSGRLFFQCLSDKVITFLEYPKEGAAFVFGDFLVYEKYVFVFATLPTVFYFSLIISVLYYLGTMQWILLKLGWVLQSIIGTTICESVVAAGNMFLGQTECPLTIRPYIPVLTASEIHAVMVSGFATVSGTTLAAYISYGADAYHLITASVMAAPASLFYSKLFYPETEESLTRAENIQLEKSTDTSLLDAASSGARNGIEIWLNVIANLIGFIAFLAFIDGSVKWFTELLGFNNVGIEFILGKIFIPISWSLGVEWKDCEAIGNVIGSKTFINEFVAYKMLGEYKKAGVISLRSSAIATYAVCGFSNPSSMGIVIAMLTSLAPERRRLFTKVAFRAYVAGCIVPMITASIAGMLMTDEMIMSKEIEILKIKSDNSTSDFLSDIFL